jgi:hypothetical protein
MLELNKEEGIAECRERSNLLVTVRYDLIVLATVLDLVH